MAPMAGALLSLCTLLFFLCTLLFLRGLLSLCALLSKASHRAQHRIERSRGLARHRTPERRRCQRLVHLPWVGRGAGGDVVAVLVPPCGTFPMRLLAAAAPILEGVHPLVEVCGEEDRRLRAKCICDTWNACDTRNAWDAWDAWDTCNTCDTCDTCDTLRR